MVVPVVVPDAMVVVPDVMVVVPVVATPCDTGHCVASSRSDAGNPLSLPH